MNAQMMNLQLILTRMISPLHIDNMWYQVSKKVDLILGQPLFKHPTEYAKFLFLSLHSNSYFESIFSTIRNTFTDGNHNLLHKVARSCYITCIY